MASASGTGKKTVKDNCCKSEKCNSVNKRHTYYGENFILDQSEKRILYINESYDGEKPKFLEEISASDCEYVIYNGNTYKPYCYNADFINDCLGLAEFITKGCLKKHDWDDCHLCDVKKRKTIGETFKKNVRIANSIYDKELDMEKYKNDYILPGNSVAIIETHESVIYPEKYPGKEILPHHVAYIMFLDTVTYDNYKHSDDGEELINYPYEVQTYITVEANAFVKRDCPEFEVYLKYSIPDENIMPRSILKLLNLLDYKVTTPNIKTFEQDLIESSTEEIGDGNFTEPKFIILTEK